MSEDTGSELPASGQWPKLAVKDFGPIGEGAVELRPLTVFAGPSNTGKSWLATLTYTLVRHANVDYGPRGAGSRLQFGRTLPDGNALKDFPEDPAAWLRSLQKDKVLRLTDSDKQVLKSALEAEQEALGEEILRCFGLAEASDLVREGRSDAASVSFTNAASPNPLVVHQCLTATRERGFSLDVDVMTDVFQPPSTEHFVSTLEELCADTDHDGLDEGESRYLVPRLFRSLVSSYHRYSSTYYLPADRGGVMHAHRVVVSALVQSASRPGFFRGSPLPTLSGVLGDFLEQLIGFADHRSRVLSEGDASTGPAGSLERKVLGGRVDIKRNDVGYPHFTYRPDGWKRDLSFMSVSSMVSELAPVVLYLRHCVRPGDLLILEEPEAHLHPEMQVCLIREIAGWVRRGIRVLITTHSEWVLDQISNIVAAHEGEKEVGLRKQDVGMWLFKPDDRKAHGSSIREIEWIVNKGGYDSDFDDVARELHNNWVNFVAEVE